MAKGFIYFINAPETKKTKIGFSHCPEDRLAMLQTGSSVRLNLAAQCPGTMQTEIEFHQKYKAYRAHGEWFSLPDDILLGIIQQYPIPPKNEMATKAAPRKLDCFAPLRIGGLAQELLEHKHDPEWVEKLANELLNLEPHILEMLIAEGEKAEAV